MRTCAVLLAAFLQLSAQSSEQKPDYQTSWPCTGKERSFDPSYLRTAEATGGQLFLFDRSETSGFPLVALAEPKHPATVTRSVGKLENYMDVRVPIDPSIESLYVSATIQCMQRVILWNPQIVEVLPQQAGGEDHVFRAVRIAVIPKPAPGIWTIRLLGTGSYSLVVKARTPTGFHADYVGGEITASTNSEGSRFRLVTESGDPLQSLTLEGSAPGRYSGKVYPQAPRFRVLMEGITPQGYSLQRIEPRLFEFPKAAP